ncbi:HD-GYP domain-containing protein [Paenibacillus sp. P36]|uniref:HD-GYP domain-containing protein n=1 Tax=Paenibacillus sp. P36 TaxID=3342538 RepID=UPI0038B32499
MNLQRLGNQPVDQLMMFIIASMASLCTIGGMLYWLVIRDSESYLYMVTSLTASLFCWGILVIQKNLPKENVYTKLISPMIIFVVVVVTTLYNPLSLWHMWVAIAFCPILLSLLVDSKIYVYGCLIVMMYVVLLTIFGPTSVIVGDISPIIAAITRGVYTFGSAILGGVILVSRNQFKKRVEALAFQQQKQQVINLLQSFIPVGERKTQTSRKEIGEMSMLLKSLVKAYGGMSVQDWEIDLLSLLHFVSRVKLPDYMFEKEGKLSEFEFEVVQEHCYMAKELCEGIPDFQEVEKAFLYHHEKVDGTGYPYQLAGDQIPLLSQMLGLVEVFLALTTPRSYRQEMSQREAYAEIQKLVGHSFRADIVEIFGKVID